MKKKLTVVMLLVLMLLSTMLSASADSVITNTYELTNVYDVLINGTCNVLAVQDYDTKKYCLMKADGTQVTDYIYTQVDASGFGPYFEVSTGSDSVIGLVDGAGNFVVPEQYADIHYYSDKWQAGISVTECSSDAYDYKSFGSDAFYMIVSVDMYFEGKLIGTLSRTDYTDYATAMGDYIRIKNRDGNYTFYDKTLTKSSYVTEYSSEYEDNYKTHQVFHVGSGQEAFVPGCTLTADAVNQAYYEVSGQILDLQGNVMFKTPYSVSKFLKEGVKVRDNNSGMYGMLDMQGNVIIPLEYKYINDGYSSYGDNAFGFFPVQKDEKFGYVDLNGNASIFKYNNDVVRIGDLFSYVQDLDGSKILITAAAGELPETYAEVRRVSSSSCPLIVVENAAGEVAVLDLIGNQVIPFTAEISDCYNVDISYDGTLMYARKGSYSDRTYTIYQLAHEYAGMGAAQAAPAQGAAASGEWACPSCAAKNSGNFCTNCGTARPQESAAVECPNCEYVAPDGEAPNFCPQCGAKLGQQGDAQPANNEEKSRELSKKPKN